MFLDFSKKKVFHGCKSQISFVGDQKRGRGDRMMEARRRSERHGDGFSGPGGQGHSANLKAWSSFLHDSWCFCTPSLVGPNKNF